MKTLMTGMLRRKSTPKSKALSPSVMNTGATSYEYNSTGITKDGSGNEMYNMTIVLVAKALAVEKTQSAQKVFAKYYDYDISKCSWKISSSYKKTGDTLSLYWLGSEHTFTKK